MENKTAYDIIRDYLTAHKAKGKKGRWISGGEIERINCKYKPSHLSRRSRELHEDGVLERRESQVNGKGAHFVEYRMR